MREISTQKEFHPNCLLCGSQNPWSLGIKFLTTEDGWVCGEFQVNSRLQGYDGILHGGVITALLDAVMTHCLFHRGIQAVTGDLRVRFLSPVSCDSNVKLQARILLEKSPLYVVEAKLVCEEQIMAKANAKFMRFTTD